MEKLFVPVKNGCFLTESFQDLETRVFFDRFVYRQNVLVCKQIQLHTDIHFDMIASTDRYLVLNTLLLCFRVTEAGAINKINCFEFSQRTHPNSDKKQQFLVSKKRNGTGTKITI